MKRSRLVSLGALMVMAAGSLAASCDDTEEEEHSQICVDEATMQRLEDDQCDDHGSNGHFWYYGSSRHPAPAVGQPVDRAHFSTTRPTFGKISTVSRAGFGGRAAGGGS